MYTLASFVGLTAFAILFIYFIRFLGWFFLGLFGYGESILVITHSEDDSGCHILYLIFKYSGFLYIILRLTKEFFL